MIGNAIKRKEMKGKEGRKLGIDEGKFRRKKKSR